MIEWGDIIDDNRQAVYGVASRYVNTAQDAEDLIQAAVLKCLEAERRGARIHNPPAYMCRAIRNLAIDGLRSARRAAHINLEFVDMFAWNTMPDAELHERVNRIRRSVSRMTDKQRDVMAMRLAGYEFDEIAQALDVTEGAAKALLHRGRQTIREAADRLRPGRTHGED